jgi:proteasome lid subunit RPN8/RPN11
MARRLLDHARHELPNESCALLAGDLQRGRVTAVHPARNVLASPYRFEVDPRDLVRIVHDIERAGEDLVAVFHSHPRGPAVPSPTDVRDARYRALHILAGAAEEATLRAWRLDGPEPIEVPIRIG